MKKILKSLLPCCLLATSWTPLFLMAGCKQKSELVIDVPDKTQICTEHDFSIKYTSNSRLPKGTRIGVVGVGSDLYVDEDKTEIGEHGGKITIRINSAIHYDRHFHFALSFSDDKTDTYIDDLNVYYVFQDDDYKDLVAPTQTLITQEDNWDYVYKFQFNNMPLSKVRLSIVGGQSYEKLEIQQQLVDVVKEGSFYYLYAPVHLSYDIGMNSFLTFDLEMTFTNSYGYTQIENINDIGCEFKITQNEIIPDVFFKNTGSTLEGFKDNVSAEAVSNFTTLKIPNYINSVRRGAFSLIDGNPDSFKSITKIVLHQNIYLLENGVFANFHNIEIIDMSDCSTIPYWLTVALVPFATNDGVHKSGIVLVGQKFDDKFGADEARSDWITRLESHGVGSTNLLSDKRWKNSWTVYSTVDEITTDDWFTTIEDKDHNIVLTGINPNKFNKDNLRNIGLIKIPDNVTKIEISNSKLTFAKFSEYGCGFNPFVLNDTPVLEWNFNRRLLLGKNLKEINANSDLNGAFYQAGICGNIILPNSLKTLGPYAFDSCEYLQPSPEKTNYGYGIEYSTQPSLKSIKDFAFCRSYIDYIAFPKSLSELGEHLFGSEDTQTSCSFLNSIDLSAFGDAPDIHGIPLDGIDSDPDGGTIYIEKYSIKDDWDSKLLEWNDGEALTKWKVELK